MSTKRYYINKKNPNKEIIFIDYDRMKGFDFSPKNNINYDGIVVNKMVIIKPSMIKKVLMRKIKKKLDLYLKLIIRFIESDDSDNGESLREALNDLTRYKSIIAHKYRKYLDEKYLTILAKKINILEQKLSNLEEKDTNYIELEKYLTKKINKL